jgi:hypothetical protein
MSRPSEFPDPGLPVPITPDYFPNLEQLINWTPSGISRKVRELGYYNVDTCLGAESQGLAVRPYSIALDGDYALAIFQSLHRDFKPVYSVRPEVEFLAVSSVSKKEPYWGGMQLSNCFQVQQFQTARFSDLNMTDKQRETAMFESLGFFDWKSIFVLYFEQAFKFQQLQGLPAPDYLSVSLWRFEDQRRLMKTIHENPEVYGLSMHTLTEEQTAKRLGLEKRILQTNQAKLAKIGYQLAGAKLGNDNQIFLGTSHVFKDLRDIKPIPLFQQALATKRY